ncbi:MAG: hypothetical protein HFJ35_03220 [Clostridia bacterium]|nr:hypothetical protein [Clostridia bacterium]
MDLPRELWIVEENAHEPLIDVTTFEKVQEILKRKNNTRNRNREYLLKGITYCHNCGNKLTFVTKTEKYKEKRYERRYVICGTANKGRCIRQYNNYDKLENEILEYIKKICTLNLKSDTYKKAILKKKNDNTEILKDYEAHIKVLEEKIQSLNKKVEQIYDDRLNRFN